MRSRGSGWVAAAAGAAILLFVFRSPAMAAFPGEVGDVAWGLVDAGRRVPQIHRMTFYGTDERALTTGAIGARDPAWSPDGQRIVFVRPGLGNGDLWVMAADGSDPVPLTETNAPERAPAWSPDGSRVVFVSRRGGSWGLFVQRVGSPPAVRLIDLRRAGTRPSWSPDGTTIAFTDLRHGSVDVLLLRLATGRVVNPRPSEPDERDVDFSPDGTKLAFARVSDGDGDIYRMRTDGTHLIQLTSSSNASDSSPAWSPDALRIVVVRAKGQGEANLVTVGAETGKPQTPLTSSADEDLAPSFQPLCTIVGTDDDDTLTGTPGPDVICGLGGDDEFVGLGGHDVLFGGDGSDTLLGGTGRDVISGGHGADVLRGQGWPDLLNGFDLVGEDRVIGGAGPDECIVDDDDERRSC